VLLRGGQVFKKYLNNPDANRDCRIAGNDGFDASLGLWFRTGDVACV